MTQDRQKRGSTQTLVKGGNSYTSRVQQNGPNGQNVQVVSSRNNTNRQFNEIVDPKVQISSRGGQLSSRRMHSSKSSVVLPSVNQNRDFYEKNHMTNMDSARQENGQIDFKNAQNVNDLGNKEGTINGQKSRTNTTIPRS
jgi:hypothetical protein